MAAQSIHKVMLPSDLDSNDSYLQRSHFSLPYVHLAQCLYKMPSQCPRSIARFLTLFIMLPPTPPHPMYQNIISSFMRDLMNSYGRAGFVHPTGLSAFAVVLLNA